MTATDIDNLEAGDEIDAGIALLVGFRWERNDYGLWTVFRPDGKQAAMHWPGADFPHNKYPNGYSGILWPTYSADIAAAWVVVAELSQVTLTQKIGAWECECFNGVSAHRSRADTPMLAICRVALKADSALTSVAL